MIEKIVSAAKPKFSRAAFAAAWNAADRDSKLVEAEERLVTQKVSSAYRQKVSDGIDRFLAGEDRLDVALDAKLEVLASELAAQKDVINSKRASAWSEAIDHARVLVKEAAAAVVTLRDEREAKEIAEAEEFGLEFEPSPMLRAIAAAGWRLSEVANYPGGPLPVYGSGGTLTNALRWIAPRK